MAQFIQKVGGTDTETLAREFGVSTMTARRDLKILEQENHLRLTWGGAVPLTFLAEEIPYSNKAVTMLDAKQAIAEYAASMITDHSCILLDAGTTTLALAERICHRPLTVITPDVRIAVKLAACQNITVHITGGVIDPGSCSCSDEASVDFLNTINVTQTFIGTNVWDVSRGASTSSRAKMRIKRKMMERAEQTVMLADSSKYGAFSPWVVSPLTEFSCLVTDGGLPSTARDAVQQSGADLRIVDAGAVRQERKNT